MKEPTITLTISEREYRVISYLVVEAFKNWPLTQRELVSVMMLNTKLNAFEDTFRRDRQ